MFYFRKRTKHITKNVTDNFITHDSGQTAEPIKAVFRSGITWLLGDLLLSNLGMKTTTRGRCG